MSTEADIVIIGGGTSGLVLATRLTEDPSIQVIVLEAGQDQTEDPRVLVPGLWMNLMGSDSEWNYATVPQALIANSKANVDAWGKLGNPGWDWETMAAYYQKAFTITLPSKEKQAELGLEYVDPKHAGTGPVKASFPDALQDPVAGAWVETFRRQGAFISGDPFSGTAVGAYTNAITVDAESKARSYAGNAYYPLSKDRPNLRVITGASVEKVLLEESTSEVRATGAQYTKDGTSYTVNARRETVIDNPNVGENLQDHIIVPVWFEVEDFVNTKDNFLRGDTAAIEASLQEYQTSKSGAFTVGGSYAGALLSLPDLADPESGASTLSSILELLPNPDDPEVTPFEKQLAGYIRACLEDPNEATGIYITFPTQGDLTAIQPGNYLTIYAGLMNPLSRGSSHIKSANAADPPIIDPRYLAHPLDLEVLARHARHLETIVASQPLASMLKPGGKRTPGAPDDLRTASMQTLKEYVRTRANNTFHSTGTCSMMPRENGGVVDSRLRVHGVTGLRVVDASVVPIVPKGKIQSTVYAVAERAADLIREDLA
ncbi:alcohol oxidase [Aspergillus avenaceus]|uniref:Alcohol oxidase n=1 Tax=Aspergillus avenaceus TaxID=36643 RepID=A0A5N6TL73_ASPAV|nr:alcohol oxidase [Aspergillus avenaceus]